MPFPTTQWGNIGNPLDSSATTADVYSTRPGPSATTPGSANGPVLGNLQILADGTFVQFLKTVATTTYNQALSFSDWESEFQVTPTSTNDFVVAVNDRAGSTTITANYFSWFTVKGLAFALCEANVPARDVVAAGATAGVLAAAVAATHLQGNIANTVVVGGAQAASPVFIS
jgi:hypothetical protein